MSATSESLNKGESAPPPPNVLVFTDAAAGKVGELIREEANPNLKLRVFVSGGGCSGFQYGFTFDEKIEEGDFCVENHGVQLLVDPMSAQYLMGA
jgi:iron-sulfur cluster insertion protein